MICEFCEGRTARKKVKKTHWLQNKLYLVENVEAEVCSECGERYFHATILDQIDSLLQAKHEVKERINVEVVSL
jgi:YgiT-type zinc finger domain-containing protein